MHADDMKDKIITIIGSAILGAAVVFGSQVTGQLETMDLNLQIKENQGKGAIPYEITYLSPTTNSTTTLHFWDKQQIIDFAVKCGGDEENCRLKVDKDDDEETRMVRSIIFGELQEDEVDTIIENLKEGKGYNVKNEKTTIERKTSFISDILLQKVYADIYEYAHFPGSMTLTAMDGGSATSNCVLDSALVYGTSGDTCAVEHTARESQTSGNMTVYWYCTAASGTPNEALTYIYLPAGAGEDADRPDTGGVAQYTSGNVDFTGCGTAGWHSGAFTGVTTVAGNVMWFLVANTEADPVTNSVTLQSRGALDQATSGYLLNSVGTHMIYFNSNGWTADGTITSGALAPMVICYASGNCYGNPYVTAGAAHASNANHRGNRITVPENLYISFFSGVLDTNYSSSTIARGATKDLDLKVDATIATRIGGTSFTPVLIQKGVATDILQTPGTSDTYGSTFTMGNSPPADVQAAGSPLCYVDGATLGSLTEACTSIYFMTIEVSENPAVTSSGGAANYGLKINGQLNVNGKLEVKNN